MKRKVLAFLHFFLFVALMPSVVLSLVSCEPEENMPDNDVEDDTDKLEAGAVDLGLSVKWASCNVGATSPEEYGGYYAWGETEEKSNYISSTYSHWNVDIDNDISGTQYDVAHVTLGGNWRMPTKEELEELHKDCTWQWTTVNGVGGYKVIGPNGNYIFLPAGGYRYGTSVDYLSMRGNTAYYWSSSKSGTNRAYNLKFSSSQVYGVGENGHNGYDGHSVRPVLKKNAETLVVIVITGEATDITKNSATLSGTISNSSQSQTCGFFYSTSSSLSASSGEKVTTTSMSNYSLSVTGLNANTTYYYRAYIEVDGEYKYGDVRSFTTESSATITNREAVDLGLSVKWASCNVGANSPEEYGDYFAWGEIVGKKDYSESSYRYYDGGIYEFIGSSICGTEYDVACLDWGTNWRMPTYDEIKELHDNCTWEWTEVNGVCGEKVTGPNGNFIFLPAAGYRESNVIRSQNSFGYYSSGTLDSKDGERAYCFAFRNGAKLISSSYRYGGQTIRPVWGNASSQTNVIKLIFSQYDVSYQATTIDVELKANVDFDCEVLGASWIREKTSTRALTTHNIVFEVDENASSNAREVQIRFYNSKYAIDDVLTIIQEGNPNYTPYESVDLGLSVKWASCNVGADSPEECGDYFAWGETEPKTTYVYSNSVTYGLSVSGLRSRGIIGADGNLKSAYDAATANWGGKWRMPTLAEVKELVNDCTWRWTTRNGVYGREVTGSNGNSIFLPAAGYRRYASLNSVGSDGDYWSSTPYDGYYNAYYLELYSEDGWYYYDRGFGFPVRPVTE